MEHFVFPGKFTIGESRATSVQMTQNSKRKTLHGILAGEDFPSKLLWRTPTKIHRERKRRRQQGNGEAERASLAQRRQRRQHSDHNMYREAATKYYNYTANETDEKRGHGLPTLQKAMRRSGNA